MAISVLPASGTVSIPENSETSTKSKRADVSAALETFTCVVRSIGSVTGAAGVNSGKAPVRAIRI